MLSLPAGPVPVPLAARKSVPVDGAVAAGVSVETGGLATGVSDGAVPRGGRASPIEVGLPDAVADAAIRPNT